MRMSQSKQVSMSDIKVRQSSKLQGRYYTLDQKMDMLQAIFCCFCEASNEYTVSQSDPNYTIQNKKGHIKQTSDCLARVFCVCNRPFSAKLRLFNEDIAIAERPCKCCLQFMPCQENELVVSNKSGRVLGYLRVGCWCFSGHFYSCADAQVQVFSGETDALLYTVEGSLFQKSLCLPCCRCCYWPNIEYPIFDSLNLKVGKIFNIYNGCLTELFSRTGKFGLEFPPKADEQHKILLLYAAMYIDYLRYETPYFCGGCR